MKALVKDSVREIKNTIKRFLSILLIVLLGVGFFAGIKAASPDMKKTVDAYFDEQNTMDLQIISTLGLTEEDIQEIKELPGVKEVEGSNTVDAILETKEEEEFVVKVQSLPQIINLPKLIEGRMPQKENECVVEEALLTGTKNTIGDQITLQIQKEFLKTVDVTIVGTIESPLYISRQRGTTKLGSRKSQLLSLSTKRKYFF